MIIFQYKITKRAVKRYIDSCPGGNRFASYFEMYEPEFMYEYLESEGYNTECTDTCEIIDDGDILIVNVLDTV